ncbi:hypothetical protein FRACYDRAFT_249965 [Fragilariopsis cylindrus CCMP1102]|uniref:Uncharacterized protein n=1 Tax=Fragilariopsis cylindrus CCMP1102 TaxID=635003 RepID=A0A1E7EQT6_9STRA|nr:hypothetical protein FRACYDRAFT_249965 [Fragilariopsis cylindrus CCMP1102]|eukprot:OEU08177.1 hypothetical protein FRACYDRAFT_249965 [Fragilariopsis cylindrus CCMP1102]
MVDTNQLPKKYVKTGNHGKLILNPEYKAWKNGESTIDVIDGHNNNNNNNNNNHANDTFNDEKNETISEQIRKQLEQLNSIKELLTREEYATKRQAILALLDTSLSAATTTTTTTIPEATAYAISPTVYEHDANIIWDFKELMLDIVGTYNIVSCDCVMMLGDPPMLHPMIWKKGTQTYKMSIDGDMLVVTNTLFLMIEGLEQAHVVATGFKVENAQDKTTKLIDMEGKVSTGKWTTIGPKHHVLFEKEPASQRPTPEVWVKKEHGVFNNPCNLNYELIQFGIGVGIATTEFEGNNITTTIIYPDKPGLGGTIKLLKTTEEDGKNDPPGGLGGTLNLLKTTEEDVKNDPPGGIISTAIPPTVYEHDASIIWDFKELMLDIVGTYNLVYCNMVNVLGDPPIPWKEGLQTYKIDGDMLVMTSSMTMMFAGIEQILAAAICFEVENAKDKTTKSTDNNGQVSTGEWTTIGPKHHVLVEEEANGGIGTTEFEENNITATLLYPDKPGIGCTVKLLKINNNPPGRIISLKSGSDQDIAEALQKLGCDDSSTAETETKNHSPKGKQKGKRWWKKEKK